MQINTKALALISVLAVVAVCLTCALPQEADAVDSGATAVSDEQELKDAFENGGSYYLTQSITLSPVTAVKEYNNSPLKLEAGKTLDLDLNGNTITCSISSDGNTYFSCQVINNQGNLTLKDTSSENDGQVINPNSGSHACTRTIKNEAGATLLIDGADVVSQNAVALLNCGTCIIRGDTFIESLCREYSGGWDNACAAIENRDSGVLEIYGGSVTSLAEAAIFSDSSETTSIYGGTFNGDDAYGDFNGTTADINIIVYGGTFGSDPSLYLDPYSYVTGSGPYVVVEMSVGHATVSDLSGLVEILENDTDSNITEVTVVGHVTIDRDLSISERAAIITIAEGATLTIADGVVVDLGSTITNYGTLDIRGYLNNPLNIIDHGSITGVSVADGGSYTIRTPMDLQWLTYLVSKNPDAVWDVYLSNDIEMPDGTEFIPIGYPEGYIFQGTFDGNGHSITGMRLSSNSTDVGMFTELANAVVKDLTLNVDCSTVTGYIGGLATQSLGNVTVMNVDVHGNIAVEGASYGVSPFLASVYGLNGETVLINCHSDADIGGEYAYNVGGMVGTASGSPGDLSIYNCSYSGTITAMGSAGYLIGYTYLDSTTLTVIAFDSDGSSWKGNTNTICSAIGGSFTFDRDEENSTYAVVGSNGTWKGASDLSSMAAVSDGVYYETLNAALNHALPGSTVTLLKDVNENVTVDQGQDVALAGGDYRVDGTLSVSGSLSIMSGTFGYDVSDYLMDGFVQNPDESVSLQSGTATAGEGSSVSVSNGGTVVNDSNDRVHDVQISVPSYAGNLTYNGSMDPGSITITVESADIETSEDPALTPLSGLNIEVSGFGVVGGYSLTVQVQVDVPRGYSLSGIKVICTEDGGYTDVIPDVWFTDDGLVTFVTDHNSGYQILGELVEDQVPMPPFWDDDEYVPPVYYPETQPVEDDDDTVTIVACAAAAVVAALMALFLIVERRR